MVERLVVVVVVVVVILLLLVVVGHGVRAGAGRGCGAADVLCRPSLLAQVHYLAAEKGRKEEGEAAGLDYQRR